MDSPMTGKTGYLSPNDQLNLTLKDTKGDKSMPSFVIEGDYHKSPEYFKQGEESLNLITEISNSQMTQSYQFNQIPKTTLAIVQKPVPKSKFFGNEQTFDRKGTDMSSHTKQTEVNTNNVSRQNKQMNNTYSQMPERKTEDMITSRAMDESTLQNAEVISSPQYSDLNRSASKGFLI